VAANNKPSKEEKPKEITPQNAEKIVTKYKKLDGPKMTGQKIDLKQFERPKKKRLITKTTKTIALIRKSVKEFLNQLEIPILITDKEEVIVKVVEIVKVAEEIIITVTEIITVEEADVTNLKKS